MLVQAEIDEVHRGRKIMAIRLYRERVGVGLREAKIAVEDWMTEHGMATGHGSWPPRPETTVPNQEEELLIQRGRWPLAVKKLKARAGLGLKEAKEIIDNYRQSLNELRPPLNPTPIRTEPITRFAAEAEFLSNFYFPAATTYDGVVYPTSEHAFQAAKTLDLHQRREFLKGTPGQSKRLGRSVTLRPDWNNIRVKIMAQVVLSKFTRNPDLRALLLQTGDVELIEGNSWHDNFWGCCRCGRPRCREPGQNHLGKTLMAVREILR